MPQTSANPDGQNPTSHALKPDDPQIRTLEILKEKLNEEGKFVPEYMDDMTLLDFLDVNRSNVDHAKEMVLVCEQGRQDLCAHLKYRSFHFKEGEQAASLWYLDTCGIGQLYAFAAPERPAKLFIEEGPMCTAAQAHPDETPWTVIDIRHTWDDGLFLARDYVMEFRATLYPERIGRLFLVRLPLEFSADWEFIKSRLNSVTLSKIRICGPECEMFLLEQIPVDNLPKNFHGRVVDPNPLHPHVRFPEGSPRSCPRTQ
ncbi:hypothetical protein M378DRAFT_158903 [Amanita muscaria Koide BX008]|uniref:CRAL-TRIO domain-containing protein n=1 Tax=Amanita muscaria (strain Koide BX008) TaxID=946122 RepID=A0A0C2XE31_AMAMK|nr:hypothetical protein M378DRAFT_158903 [Amanita muscaria Koide BX008]